jgi:hypothetical protein
LAGPTPNRWARLLFSGTIVSILKAPDHARRRLNVAPMIAILLFVCAIPLLAIANLELERRQLASHQSVGEGYYLPPPAILRGLSFGYNELGADMMWVRTIAYFTDHLRDRQLSHLHRHVKNILALDDNFREVYRFASAMFMSRGERQTNDDVHHAIELLKRGHEAFPTRYEFPLTIGTHYMTELKTKDKALQDKYRTTGADWIRRAILVGATGSWLPSLAAQVYTKQGKRELAIRHLQELYLLTKDRKTRRQIAIKLKHLHANQMAADMKRYEKTYRQAHKNGPVPYVAPDLYSLIHLPAETPYRLPENEVEDR